MVNNMVRKNEPVTLDDYCDKILLGLSFIRSVRGKRKVRFTELHECLNEYFFRSGISKPTLSLHLKHLVEKKLVIRKVEDVKCVTYRINEQKLKNFMKKFDDYVAYVKWFSKEQKKFLSEPPRENFEFVFWIMVLERLRLMKYRILYACNPEDWDALLTLRVFEKEMFLTSWEKLVIKRCVEDENYRREALSWIEETWNKLFPDEKEAKERLKKELDELKKEVEKRRE